MKMKKLAGVMAAGVTAVSLLAGCGSSSGTGETASSASDSVVTETAAEASSAAEGETDAESTSGSAQEADGNTDNASADASSDSTDTGSTASGNSSTLIVYFDYSENMGDTSNMSVDAITSASLASGTYVGVDRNNLQVMKDEIQKQTGADVYSVRVTDPYDPDYNTMVGVAQEDQNNNKQFTFVDPLPDLSNYTTIYMGMPVWWGGLPQPMVCLLDQYDFSGKIINPFGIHLGSRFGQMISQIEEAEPGAMVNEDGLTENAHTPNAQVITDVDDWIAGM